MKDKKTDIKVSELFRQKLEGYEVTPGHELRKELMRKLEFQEFMRFNPYRFNIWYVALLTALTTTLLLLLLSRESTSKPVPEVDVIPGNEILISTQPAITSPSIPTMETPVIASSPPAVTVNKEAVHPAEMEGTMEERIVTPLQVVSEGRPSNVFNGMNQSEARLAENNSGPSGVLFETSAKEGCSPLKLKFRRVSGLCDSCIWSFGDGGVSAENEPEWIYDAAGEFKVELTVFCPQKPPVTSFVLINVFPKPVARFEINAENPAMAGDAVTFLNFSSGASSFKWDFGDGEISDNFQPKHEYDRPGNYNVSLVAISENGCHDSVIVENALSGPEYFISFPNAFIPNQLGPSGGYYSARSDESANIFHPVFSGVTDYQLKIFSKRGIMIFESHDVNIGWDGYLNGSPVAAGVYIWKVRGKFRNGETFIRMGDVTLLKDPSN